MILSITSNVIDHQAIINNRINSIVHFVKHNGYSSYDLYDGLTSPVAVIFKNSPIMLGGLQQISGRFPINLRPFLGIKPIVHTKTLSDFISAYSCLHLIDSSKEYGNHVQILIQNLVELSVKGKNGRGWGLRFPISTRFMSAGDQVCNSFNTINVIHSFLDAYIAFNKSEYLTLAIDGFLFLEYEMGYKDFGNYMLWNYWAGLESEIYNVNGLMLGLCARLFKITKDEKYSQFTRKLYASIVRGQNLNGSWYYSNTKNGHWVDGFHTGYILEGLVRGVAASIIDEKDECLRKGVNFYLSTMFTADGMPKYYPNSVYPIDSQNGAQAIQTITHLINLGLSSVNRGCDIFLSVDRNLWNPKGYYNPRKTKFWTIKIPMHRWATSPMFLALSLFKYAGGI